MIFRASIASLLTVARLAAAEPDVAAKAKLQDMADAIKAAKSLSYKVASKGEGGMLAGFNPKGTATVYLERNPADAKLCMFRIEGTSAPAFGNEPPSAFLVVSDGTRKAWKEESQKTVMERFNAQAGGGQVELANSCCALEVIDPDLLVKALAAPAITLDEATEADGVMCDVIKTDDGRQRPHRFFIAQSDRLPRRIEHRIEGGGMNDAQVWLITEVKLNAPIPAGSFAISTPEGWTFSPATTPPAATPSAPAADAPPPGGKPTALTPPPIRQRAVGLNAEDLAPDFELASGTGEKVKLSALQGNVVVLDFWGTWCLPCKKASPEIQKLVEDYKGKPVKAYGLAVRETSDEKPINYMKEGNYTYGLLLKADDVAKTYRVKAYPTYFVIGKDGQVVYSTAGYDDKTFPAIRTAVDAALEGKPMPKVEAKPPAQPGADGKADEKPAPKPAPAKKNSGL